MMAAERIAPELLDRLPAVRGSYEPCAVLAPTTWFRVGGPAEVLYTPADTEDLATFMRGKPADVPVTIIGLASNLLIRDGGIPGITIKLGRAFNTIDADGTALRCGGSAVDASVATTARDHGIAGLEFFTGIPGTIGGAVRMNAGAYGREVQDVLISATAMDETGTLHKLTREDLGFSYRHCAISANWVFIGAELKGITGNADEITKRIREIRAEREDAQPVQSRTGGSTFANPSEAKAWELIDRAGCRGLIRGGATVSEKHCNFLINTGTATASDLEGLGDEVRRRVLDVTGIPLTWEIRRVGVISTDETAPINRMEGSV
ncbi:MAG: UDP-N-acetylmuramate dehydrogenase [Rhodospirillaceae bacterium]|mgnify:FL=1|jgi:UDP-N-acetylmuramate dehydrogenase|nr:UDP-N-acetylmuramate dehydrogenase [Rhodospirillaceae bacterium]MBT5239898.1 UDP-N-acetylmuramate dehydrogenase [Rhodospirillaceae bacterium]MBT5565226.1 UDP-N-acetylmuramate dehydrogenase [Rhodospirillaceae bacterium]MBT6091084.1 UDP-N-acetylmuramate dehydrogenase [Rhodospirillaceae bacterium]MBT6961201.1 UDP-N-acetylmuramate dehydrogenase [Rhodospirillaceae bacterium]